MARGPLTELEARLRAPVPLPERRRPALSGRLLQAMTLYVTGRSQQSAAIEMGIAPRAYEDYLGRARDRLGAHTMAEAAYLFGVQHGEERARAAVAR